MTDTSRSAPQLGCPEFEVLAAFVDGRLPAAERTALIAHLADCDGCREVVAEATLLAAEMDGDEESASLRPFPERRPARRWALAGIAAALIAGAVGLYLYLRPSPDRLLASLIESGATSRLTSDWGDPRWPVMRGGEREVNDLAQAFRFGVRSVDLDLALSTGDFSKAERFALECAASLATQPFADLVAQRFRSLATRIGGAGAADARLATEAKAAVEEARDFVDASHFALGRWAETGRLAASLGAPARMGSPPALPAGARNLSPAVATAVAASRSSDPEAAVRALERLLAEAGTIH